LSLLNNFAEMLKNFEIKIALRYLRSKKKDGFVSVVTIFSFLGIMLGVATLIVTMAVMNGVKTELVNRIIGINAHLSINNDKDRIENYQELINKFQKIEGVKYVQGIIQGQVLGVANGVNRGVLVRGVKLSDLKNKPIIRDGVVAGELKNIDEDFGALVGVHLSNQMGLNINDKIKLVTPETAPSIFGGIPRSKDFNVVGVFDVGMYEYDSSTLFISLESAQRFFQKQNAVTAIEIEVADPKDIANIKQEIAKIVEDGFSIIDWKAANEGYIEAINVQSNVLFLILALIIVVAAFNIISGMVMLVNDKSKEVAILRTIGLTKASVIKIFFICGSAIGVAGTLCGLGLGLAFSANIEEIRQFLEGLTNTNLFSAEIYFLSKLPAEVRMQDVINITILSLGVSFLATLYPSFKAAKVLPAEALRYE
jgi:lipoprotein-releasing system permease protein